MGDSRLFVGKADYEFGNRYVLLHVGSAVSLSFTSLDMLSKHLLENYGRNYKKKISYEMPENDKLANISKTRKEKGLDDIVYNALKDDEKKLINEIYEKIVY